MKTLVLCPIGLGNFIMATPALRCLSDKTGRNDLAILALKPGIRHMAECSRYFGQVFAWDPDNEGKKAGLRVLLDIRRERFGAVILLFPTCQWKYLLFAFLTGIPRKIGFLYPGRVLPIVVQSFSHPVDTGMHDTFQNLRLVRWHLEH